MSSATITNVGTTQVIFKDAHGILHTITPSTTLTLPTTLITWAEVRSALSSGAITISGWTPIANIVVNENTAALWTSTNIVVANGEIGRETDTNLIKIGDGRTAWTALPYSNLDYNGLLNKANTNYILKGSTTNATAKVLTSDKLAAGTNNQFVLANNSAATFTGSVIARKSNGDTFSWTIAGAIRRGANAAATALVAAVTPTVVANDSGASAWTLGVTADTTNGALALTFTGATSSNITTTAYLETVTTTL